MSGPVADLDFAWIRGALPGFKQRLHAHQKSCPPRTAVVHEFHRLLPTFVFEQDDGVAIGLTELPVDMSGDPLLRSVHHLPQHAIVWVQLEHLHVEPASTPKSEFEDAASVFALALSVGCPPAGKSFGTGQGRVNLVRRRLNSNPVQDVYHFDFPSATGSYKL